MLTAVITIYFITLVIGVLGIVIPPLPGIPLMFLSSILFNFYLHRFSVIELVVLGLIFLVSIAVDYFSGILVSKYFGASSKALYAGFLGFIIGTIVLPPFGGLVGLFAGILIGELIILNGHKQAVKSAAGGVIGAITGIVANLALGLTFIILSVIFIF